MKQTKIDYEREREEGRLATNLRTQGTTVVSLLDFTFASYIQDLEMKKPTI